MERGLMAKEEWKKLGLGKVNEVGGEGMGDANADLADGHVGGEEIGMEKNRRKDGGST